MRWIFLLCIFTALAFTPSRRLLATAQNSQNNVDCAAYFPIRQGDVWTYDWQSRQGSAAPQTVKRTRAFEGREFVNTGSADKLASENGDYALFSLNEQGLWLHGAAEYERDARYLFDPPIAILTREMQPGQPLVVTQLEEDGKTLRTFTSLFEGVVPIETPLGKFTDCLKVTWEMDAAAARQRTTYFLAKGVGIVAYQIEVKAKHAQGFALSVDARLRLAQLQGRTYTRLEDLQIFGGSALALAESGKARTLFRKAHEALYVWDKKFPGFEAAFRLQRPGLPDASGTLRVNRQLQVEVHCADAKARAQVHAELSQFVTYRQSKNFEDVFGEGKARIGHGALTAEITEITISDEESAGASYWLREREIVRVTRSYGRVRFVNQIKNFKTEDGRYIANEADLTYYSNETGAVAGQIQYQDRYAKNGSYWLPLARQKSETVKGKTETLELLLSDIRYLK
jgi:hypothetical protein